MDGFSLAFSNFQRQSVSINKLILITCRSKKTECNMYFIGLLPGDVINVDVIEDVLLKYVANGAKVDNSPLCNFVCFIFFLFFFFGVHPLHMTTNNSSTMKRKNSPRWSAVPDLI